MSREAKRSMTLIVGYTSAGRLFLKEGDRASREVTSPFAEGAVSRALRRSEKDAWKRRPAEGMFGGRLLWGTSEEPDAALVRPRITGLARAPDQGCLYFILETQSVGGLFHLRRDPQEEQRLFHKEGFHAKDPEFHPHSRLLAFSLPFPNGVSSIAVCDAEGRNIDRVTEGDSVDEAPSWLPDATKAFLYHSGGVARTSAGHPVGLAPCSIHRMDLATSKAELVMEDRGWDFLQPHGMSDGDLLFIRRPYEPPGGKRVPFRTSIKDAAFFPFRVVKSVFDFLNAFAIAFSQKPLTTAGGPKLRGPDLHTLLVRGRAVDARKALEDFKPDGEPPPLVPSTWELVRRGKRGGDRTLAKGVMAFDVGPDGTVLYTTGSAVYAMVGDEPPRRLEKGSLIDQVVFLEREP